MEREDRMLDVAAGWRGRMLDKFWINYAPLLTYSVRPARQEEV
jgi:hypothetical protein